MCASAIDRLYLGIRVQTQQRYYIGNSQCPLNIAHQCFNVDQAEPESCQNGAAFLSTPPPTVPLPHPQIKCMMQWRYKYAPLFVFHLVTSLNCCLLVVRCVHCCSFFISEPGQNLQVERVTEIAKLVTQLLKHNWSLAVYLRPITSQYFKIIQTYVHVHVSYHSVIQLTTLGVGIQCSI